MPTTLGDFQVILDAIPYGISIHSPNGDILEVNAYLCDILKKKREEIVGKKCYKIYHGKDSPPSFCPFEKTKISKKRESGEAFEPALKTWLFITTTPILGKNGEVEKAVHVIRDITMEKRLYEERALLSAIVESSDDAIIGKTLDGVITSWNKGAEKIYGYSQKEVIGRSISILVPPGRPDELPNIYEKIKRGEHVEHFETIRITKDKRIINVSLTISSIKDASGNIIGASAIARDTTEHKNIDKELKKKISDLERFNKVAVDREIKMIELKKKISELEMKIGRQ